MLIKQNSLILKIEVVCSPKRRRNQRCYAVRKHDRRLKNIHNENLQTFIKYLLR